MTQTIQQLASPANELRSAIRAAEQVLDDPAKSSRIQHLDLEAVLRQLIVAAKRMDPAA